MNLQSGQTIHRERYTIVKRLGQGGMGAVYLAIDRNLQGQQVAIKQSLETARHAQLQFRSEADTLTKLNHPNLPRITNFFTDKGLQYLAMDYIDGQDLRKILSQRSEPLDEKVVMGWLDQIMDALEYMHSWTDPNTGKRTPIIHRDIKPGNIKQASDGRIVLVDFGIAKVTTGGGTLTGARAHTPGFSPVEQYTGTGTDVRSDVYSLGATVYSLLTRQIPPEAPDIAASTVTLSSPRTVNPRLSRQVDTVVMRAMKTKPTERYQNIYEMRKGLMSRWPEIRIPTPLSLGGGNAGTAEGGFFQKTTTNTKRPITSTTARGARNPILLMAGLTLLVFFAAVFLILQEEIPPVPPSISTGARVTDTTVDNIPSDGEPTRFPTITATEGLTQDQISIASATQISVPTRTPTEEPDTPVSTPLTRTPTEQPDTPTRLPTRTPTEEPNTPTRTPTRTPTYTPTRSPTRTPVDTSTPTRTSLPTQANTPTLIPAPSGGSRGTVNLLEPLAANLSGSVTFRWATAVTLQDNEYYELIFWQPGQDPFTDGFSPSGASKNNFARVNLDSSIRVLEQLNPGNDYLWGVRIVTLNPFQPLATLSGQHRFRLDGSSGGSSSSGSSGGGGTSPTPTPRG